MKSEQLPNMTINDMLLSEGIAGRNGYCESSEPGKKYEQWIYYGFKSQFQKGNFDEVKRNQYLEFPIYGSNDDLTVTREIDVLFRRKGILGFVSIKTGRGFVKNGSYREEKRIILDTYPEYLAGKPCLRVLIYKYGISRTRFKRMIKNSVLIVDNIAVKTDFPEMFEMVFDAVDYLAETGDQLPADYYNRCVNKLCNMGNPAFPIHNTYINKLLQNRKIVR